MPSFETFRKSLGHLPELRTELFGRPIHHFAFPRSSYSGLVLDPQNLFVTPPNGIHLEKIHSAFSGTRGMKWPGIEGAETGIRNMFNFWVHEQHGVAGH